MFPTESDSNIPVTIYFDAEEYNQHLLESDGKYHTNSRAVGIEKPSGEQEIVVDALYYLSGGIPPQLSAIVVHEETELMSTSDNLHFDGRVKEYRHIFIHFGQQGLKLYHANLCNLMGGRNDERNQALIHVLDTTD